MQDWELVTQRLGTTHLQLAAHLRALLTLAKVLFEELAHSFLKSCCCNFISVPNMAFPEGGD